MPLLLHLQQGTPTLSELQWWMWKVRLFGVQSQNHPGSCSHADLRKGARGPYTPSTYLDRGPLTRGWLTLTLGQAQNPGSCMLVDQKTNPRSRKLHACDHQGRPSTRKTENTVAPAQVIVRGQQHIGTQCKYSRENPYVDVRASQYIEGCLYIEISASLMSKRLCPCFLWCRPNTQRVSLHGLKGKPSSKEVNKHK